MNNYPYHEKRYQYQPWYIRLGRRLRYQPLSIFAFIAWLIGWSYEGFPKSYWVHDGDGTYHIYLTRLETFNMARLLILHRWKIRAGWYVALGEAMSKLRSHRANQNQR